MKVLVCCSLMLLSGSMAFAQGGRHATELPPAPFRADLSLDSSMPGVSAPPDAPASLTLPGASVSVRQLQIPPKALKELQRASKEFIGGNRLASIEHLEKALRLYPDFKEGHNSLGIQYVRLQQFDKALGEFRTAAALDARYVEPVNNQSAVLFIEGRLPEAESTARHALDLDPEHRPTRYLLGRILAAENQNTPETLELLRQSRTNFPVARLVLAQVLAKVGQTDEAVDELRAYLLDPNATEKDTVSRVLATLQPNAAAASATSMPPAP